MLRMESLSQSAVKGHLNVNQSPIYRLWQRLRMTGSSTTTPRQDCAIRLADFRYGVRTAVQIATDTQPDPLKNGSEQFA